MGRPLLRDEVPVGPCKVRALFSWSGESPQDLGFVEGDIIEVLNNGDGDWWTGKLKRNKLVGIFPRNFAEYVNENQETISAARKSAPVYKKSNMDDFVLESFDIDATSISDLQIPEPEPEPQSQIKDRSRLVPINQGLAPLSSSQVSTQSFYPSKSPHLGASAGSSKSSKSTKEILDDVGAELNRGFLDDINLDVKPEELRTPELESGDFGAPFGGHTSATSRPGLSLSPSVSPTAFVESTTNTSTSSKPPPVPPHTVSLSSSRNSNRSAHSRGQSMVPSTPITEKRRSTKQAPQPSAQPAGKQAPAKPAPKSSALTGPVISKGTNSGLGIGNAYSNKNYSNKDFNSSAPSTAMDEQDDPCNIDPCSVDPNVNSRNADPIRRNSLSGSPLLDEEVPFDPRTFKPESKIPDHIGSHFDNSAYGSQLGGNPSGDGASLDGRIPSNQSVGMGQSVVVNKTRTAAKAAAPAAVYYPTNGESKKPNFIQRLFPKNSQLRRTFSRSSQKSSKSTKSVTSRLKNMKSLFSFSPNFEPDDSLYPTNNLAKSSGGITSPNNNHTNAPSIEAPGVKQPAVNTSATPLKPISTPPRNSKVTSTYDTTSKMKANTLSTSTSSNKNASTLLGVVSAGPLASKEAVGGKWIETRRDLYRAQTLTERDMKKRRQELELQGINCDNLVERLNALASEDFHDYRLESFDTVDQAVLTMSTWPQLMTPSVFASSRIGRHFQDPVERVRAVFLLCATRISHVSQTPQPNNVMQTRTATPAELAATVAAMCSAVDIECIVVDGHIRSAGSNAKSISSTPHSWNAVKIHDEWRLLDAVTAASSATASGGDLDDDEFVNLFYFLTPPAQLIFSHVPNNHHHQFYQPELPTASAALLPLASPGAFAHNILFDEFWLGLTRVTDLEVVELTLQVPDASKDVVALVDGQSSHALSQAFWDDDGQRHFRVKAFVPQHNKQSILQLYVVPKSQADRDPQAMELIWTVELRHVSGGKNNAPFDFIGRYATPPTSSAYDLYVQEPQCRSLGGGDLYTFRINTFDASQSLAGKTPQPKLAIQSPSGRLTRMVPIGTDVNDTFKVAVKTLEVGTWRAVVRRGDSDSWVPFAEWFCS